MSSLIDVALLLPLAGVVLPSCLYLGLLTLLAPFGLRRKQPVGGALRRFVVLVPAHDEQQVLGRLLTSLGELDYPRELVQVCVVADNCSDATAAVARAHGAEVFERRDERRIGKGYALQWLLDQLRQAGRSAGGYVIVDADSVVSPNFLRAMNGRLVCGASVIQGYYTVLHVNDTPAESLREAALALVHFLRPAAKTAIDASCGLKGNGMCFAASVIEGFGWPAAGLAEDVEFHLTLLAEGIRVEFAPEAVVRGEMPPSLRAARSQNLRWEAGRLATIRAQALPLLGRGLRRCDVAMVDAALEQLLPPLSVPAALGVIVLIAAVVAGSWVAWPAAALLLLLALHVLAGLMLARVGAAVYRSLLHAPLYMVWKLALYTRALLGPRQRRWVRTERAPGQ